MKNINYYFFTLLLVIFSSCNTEEALPEKKKIPKATVQLTSISIGSISDEIVFLGTTFYLKRNLVTASIPAFIAQVNVKLGSRVNKGDILYVLQSKESRALFSTISLGDSTLNNFGIIEVRASATGIISTLDKQQAGDYILEGTQLCTIAESNDLIIKVNVPFEYTDFTKRGRACTLILPNRKKYTATFTRALTAMNVTAQTQIILAKCTENLFLPENMVVEVKVNTAIDSEKQIVPKSCVLSDEMLLNFWVMQLINDSIAIKVPVAIGNKNETQIEIITPQFKPTDKLISIGNYGLNDTALVVVQ